MKYNIETILYNAAKPKGFNVDIEEHTKRSKGFTETDIERNVRLLVEGGFLVLKAEDDSDKYYFTTLQGDIKLLQMQIKFRKNKGKDVSDLIKKLSDLELLV